MYGNDSAFPWSIGYLDNCAPAMREGVTKRELFAALICAGLIANPDCSAEMREGVTNMARVAEGAVDMADALIDALNKREDNY